MSILIASFIMLASATLSTPGSSAEPPAEPKKPASDMTQVDPMVCHSFQELGSRIKRRKVCMHKSEWDRQNLEEKQMIDRTQVLRGMVPAG